jgi:hypothetical protein
MSFNPGPFEQPIPTAYRFRITLLRSEERYSANLLSYIHFIPSDGASIPGKPGGKHVANQVLETSLPPDVRVDPVQRSRTAASLSAL